MSPTRPVLAVVCWSLLAAGGASALEPGPPTAGEVEPAIVQALDRLYNFDFETAHEVLDGYVRRSPQEPLGYVFRAATYLFSELDRLDILATEFFRNDTNLRADKNAKPDPDVRARFLRALDRARGLANTRLAVDSDDQDALFALTLTEGLYTDYLGLVEKRGLKSLGAARTANRHAQRLLALDPDFHDAYLGAGVNEYLLANLPFFVRWFVRMEGIEGDKQVAVERLRLVADRGVYLAPFARILLSIVALREDRPARALELLESLNRDFPENPLFRSELAELRARLGSSELTAN